MAYNGEGRGERGPGNSWKGTSNVKLDNAIRAAVHASGVPENTTFVVTEIKVTTKGDPNVGAYSVILTPGAA
jgi:hypothetical protein